MEVTFHSLDLFINYGNLFIPCFSDNLGSENLEFSQTISKWYCFSLVTFLCRLYQWYNEKLFVNHSQDWKVLHVC